MAGCVGGTAGEFIVLSTCVVSPVGVANIKACCVCGAIFGCGTLCVTGCPLYVISCIFIVGSGAAFFPDGIGTGGLIGWLIGCCAGGGVCPEVDCTGSGVGWIDWVA